jgi:ABC-type Fe3+/spermidine/putrescine transport system ATPase subunit
MSARADAIVLEARELFRTQGDGDRRFVLAIDELALRVGEATAILGPNGSGKTTLLRVLAGVDRTRGSGEIRCAAGRITLVSQRPVAFAGSVLHNVKVGLLAERLPRAERDARARAALARFDIEGLAEHDARTLSGGELRRLALARAMVGKPAVLLLDEPFDDLDAEGQRRLSLDLAATLAATGIALVVVTHDLRRALLLADRIVVLSGGKVAQQGPRAELLAHPATREVAALVGMTNLAVGHVVSADARTSRIALASGRILETVATLPTGARVWLGIRPEHLKLDVGKGEGLPLGEARVESLLDDGLATVVELAYEGEHFTTHLLSGRGLARRLRVGDSVDLAVSPEQVHARVLEA